MALPSVINLISICSGIGGLDLGLSLGAEYLGVKARVVCYVEIEAYACSLLAKRMEEGVLDSAPIWTDVKSFPGIASQFRGKVHGIIAGYPCQPFSAAGKRGGVTDPRHIFPDIRRTIRAVEPVFCFFENVRGHLSLGFDAVQRCLHRDGFAVEPGLFSAGEVGAGHRRERLYILAVSNHARSSQERSPSGSESAADSASGSDSRQLANASVGQLPESGWRSSGRDGIGSAGAILEHAESDIGRSEFKQGEQGEHWRRGPSGASEDIRIYGKDAPCGCWDLNSWHRVHGMLPGERCSNFGSLADASEPRLQGRQLGIACDGNGGAGNTWISCRTSSRINSSIPARAKRP